MRRSASWLHLSDWHQRGPDFERQVVRDKLVEDIRQRTEIDSRLEQVDFVVFSGDLAFSGQTTEYATAEREFLAPVLEAAGVPKERLFMVPGNHDLSRAVLKYLARWLDIFGGIKEVNAALSDAATSALLLRPMDQYSQFVRAFFGDKSVADPAYSFLSSFEVQDLGVALVGLNTAWLCGQRIENGEVNDLGALALGEPQFHDIMNSGPFREADLRIGVLHHPFSWLADRFDRSRIEQTLMRGFDFLLRGHEHEARITIPNGTDGNCAVISAGAAYDRRDGKMNGYNFVHLDLDKLWGTVFLRRYDIGLGYLKDTNTTGDATPGYHRFRVPRKIARSSVRAPLLRAARRLVVERVVNYRSLDVIAAMDLYAARIPAREQVNAPDFIRWLREDDERLKASKVSRDFLFVAKLRDEVCGFALLHSNPLLKLAFIAYLVAVPGVRGQSLTISAALLEEVAKLFAPGGDLAEHSGVLLEVDDPRNTLDAEQMREQLARVRLFTALAERERSVLQGLDFPYRQPLLHLPRKSEGDREIPLLLMFAQRPGTRIERFFARERIEELLEFMYGWLYPESYSEIDEENVEYRQYVSTLHTRISQQLPDKVPTLDFGEIQRWSEGLLVEPQESSRNEGAP